MTPGHSPTQDMKLIGIISHQSTKDNGHYTAITKRDDKWTLCNDAITTETTTKRVSQTQAYILMYSKSEQSIGRRKSVPGDIPGKLESQSKVKGNPNPRLETQQRKETSAPQPELSIKTPPDRTSLDKEGKMKGPTLFIERDHPQKAKGDVIHSSAHTTIFHWSWRPRRRRTAVGR